MLRITLNKIAQATLLRLLEKEGDPKACFRFREFSSGCGGACRGQVRRVLKITLDQPADGDLCTEVMGITFVMEEYLTANYGKTFFISVDTNQIPTVWPLFSMLK